MCSFMVSRSLSSGTDDAGRPVADIRMLLDVFEQGLCGPTVAGGVPVAVVGPVGVRESGALAEDVVGLVDDGDVEGCPAFLQTPREFGLFRHTPRVPSFRANSMAPCITVHQLVGYEVPGSGYAAPRARMP